MHIIRLSNRNVSLTCAQRSIPLLIGAPNSKRTEIHITLSAPTYAYIPSSYSAILPLCLSFFLSIYSRLSFLSTRIRFADSSPGPDKRTMIHLVEEYVYVYTLLNLPFLFALDSLFFVCWLLSVSQLLFGPRSALSKRFSE